ncbi:hypothetical protein BB561_001134 [Smittium simulii]|uniref:BIR-domain-containing protein n=1 Tax=Smittium simulii TaxID=133385 RepID=A0A2T9YW73_9FUNG|nr:hypothetical protein BB561_001134 [Smittium simulii]
MNRVSIEKVKAFILKINNDDNWKFYYENRYKTFTHGNWPYSKNRRFLAQPAALASAGFYFFPQREHLDNVRCAFCDKELGEWEPSDDPFVVHYEHSSTCIWANLHCRVRYCSENGEKHKKWHLDTLTDKQDLLNYLDQYEMASAGFYHAPDSLGDDSVKCGCCNCTLESWEPNDDPLFEHKRRNPDCLFFQMGKLLDTIKPMKNRFPDIIVENNKINLVDLHDHYKNHSQESNGDDTPNTKRLKSKEKYILQIPAKSALPTPISPPSHYNRPLNNHLNMTPKSNVSSKSHTSEGFNTAGSSLSSLSNTSSKKSLNSFSDNESIDLVEILNIEPKSVYIDNKKALNTTNQFSNADKYFSMSPKFINNNQLFQNNSNNMNFSNHITSSNIPQKSNNTLFNRKLNTKNNSNSSIKKLDFLTNGSSYSKILNQNDQSIKSSMLEANYNTQNRSIELKATNSKKNSTRKPKKELKVNTNMTNLETLIKPITETSLYEHPNYKLKPLMASKSSLYMNPNPKNGHKAKMNQMTTDSLQSCGYYTDAEMDMTVEEFIRHRYTLQIKYLEKTTSKMIDEFKEMAQQVQEKMKQA